jgi:hypothetical protein
VDRGHTPRSVWLELSGAHYWDEACFIPAVSDRAAVERVVRRFLELQGDDLNEGLVFREFVPLAIVGVDPKSQLPLAAEIRSFWLDGEPILSHRYWGKLTSFDAPLPFETLRPIARRIPSRFFTMDVAALEGGGFTIVELGDGQTAGLPAPALAPEFFAQIASSLGP